LLDFGALAQSRMTLYVLFALIAVALGTMWLTAHGQPSAPPDTTHISGTTVPPSAPSSR
jgi:hypothetical protein